MSIKRLRNKENMFSVYVISLLCISPVHVTSKSQMGRWSSVEHRLQSNVANILLSSYFWDEYLHQNNISSLS